MVNECFESGFLKAETDRDSWAFRGDCSQGHEGWGSAGEKAKGMVFFFKKINKQTNK